MEQMRGVEPANSSVAHWCADRDTFTCLAVSEETLVVEPASAPERVRKLFVGWVGIEPTSRGLRDRCKDQHLLPTHDARALVIVRAEDRSDRFRSEGPSSRAPR